MSYNKDLKVAINELIGEEKYEGKSGKDIVDSWYLRILYFTSKCDSYLWMDGLLAVMQNNN